MAKTKQTQEKLIYADQIKSRLSPFGPPLIRFFQNQLNL